LNPVSLEGPIQRISIITVCRNAEASIADTMRSVLRQTAVLSGRVELEYLVHDGMSTDRTLEIVESLRAYP
jgi:glycosyltransferase involved in cell wall biosynthesis